MEFCKFYTKISQFSGTLPLRDEVASDHAEIMLDCGYGVISAWNISNPAHHHYFGINPNYTFSQTHMYNLREDILEDKVNKQMNHIIERLLQGVVDIQIVVEGYLELYNRIKPILNSLGIEIFYDESPQIPTVLEPPDRSSALTVPIDRMNVTAIMFNKSAYAIQRKIIFSDVYIEENDTVRTGEMRKVRLYDIPVIYLRTYDGSVIVVGGVHIHGSNSRFPKSGLNLFTQMLSNILSENFSQVTSLIFMGDFNTVPKHVGDALKDVVTSGPRFKILLSDYPTSVNPGNEVSYYDMAVVYQLNHAVMLPLDQTGVETQALIESICRSRSHYLSKE